jgi:hypothetical protein
MFLLVRLCLGLATAVPSCCTKHRAAMREGGSLHNLKELDKLLT